MLRRLTVVFCPALLFAQASKPVDFQREVRPILSDNCFHCHGPDAGTRMAGLRLDRKEDALAEHRRGAAVVPKAPEASLLYKRISEPNPARRMPPEMSHKTLTKEQIALLKRWIEQGAPWTEHWAFRAPEKVKPPSVRNPAWVSNPIDRFILSRLDAEALTPAPRADKRTLIRRVALDVTGLPPTPAEVELFLKDLSPGAYEKMVDRYLASPHYGEHRGRYWLDAARYGDTHGIHIDNYREIWPYRDWVIEAFNRNMPFDEFTVEQLAGDLLPNATLEQKIATGFHRCNVTTSEGGAIDDEYIEIYAKDRADTTGAVWLGLTVGCATCHDHKFDPISQKDFYALGAFFRNTPQRAMDGNVADTPPLLFVPAKEDREDWTRVQTQRQAIRTSLAALREKTPAGFEKWLPSWKEEVRDPLEYTSVFFVPQFLSGEIKGAPKLNAAEPFSISAAFTLAADGPVNVPIASMNLPKDKSRGWSLDVNKGIVAFRMVGDDLRSVEIRSIATLAPGPHHVVVTWDGSRHQSGLTLMLDGREVTAQGRGDTRLDFAGSVAVEAPLKLGKVLTDFRIFDRLVTESEAVLLKNWRAAVNGDEKALLEWYLHHHDSGFQKLVTEEIKLAEEAGKIEKRGAITLVMEENPGTPFAHTLFRGAYDQKRDKVEARTPSVLPPMTSDLPRNRLGFAKWLFTPEHPLTARVAVNRMWQEIFGTGLVKTADDFGSQGEPPSHPELLDWLAVDFRENGWNIKRFYKQILMSSTYRQTAQVTPAKLAKDPENRLLSRAPRFRMDAEMVRDYALATSGLMAKEIGGPSVRPYQPEGIWEAVAMVGSNTRFYKRDQGEGLYRRSMYTFWKRSAPPASMDIFNAPTRESCTMRRERTNTPLQALVTLNDEQFFEAARALAERAMQASADFQTRIDRMATRVLVRPLTITENRIVRKAYDDYLAYYNLHPADARKLLSAGERKADPSLPAPEYAAFTMVANQLLNLDEVLNK